MQFGVKIDNYKRLEKKSKNKKSLKFQLSFSKIIFNIISAVLISRVTIGLSLGEFNNLAPFGVAYVLAFLNNSKKQTLIVSVGVVLGYLSLIWKVEQVPMYILMLLAVVIFFLIPLKIKNKINIFINLFILFSITFIYGLFIVKSDILLTLISSVGMIALIYPIYYMIKYTLKCLEDIKVQHFFSTDEIISIGLFLCLVIVGIGNIKFLGLDIRNIVALFFVIFISYITDINMGACIGISMGLILGFASGDLLYYVTIYGACGLICGIFKEAGKVLTFLSFNIIFIAITIYTKNFTIQVMQECLISSLMFLFIPKKIFENLVLEINKEKKIEHYSEVHFKKIKQELTSKLRDFTDVLGTMSITLNNLVNNDKLMMKNKGNALVENLSDRTCSECDMRYMCWKRELHATYNGFAELINNYESGINEFPKELEKKCIKKYALIKNLEETINNHIINEMLRQRMGEGRKLLANHINNMALTIDEIVDDFNKELILCVEVEKLLRKSLLKNNIEFSDILCYNDKSGRLNIKLNMNNCCGAQLCVKEALPIINKIVGRTMSIGGEGCCIDPKTNICEVLIEESPKYHISSCVAVATKSGEKYTGDSYSYGKTKDGNYIVVVSDGMGSGPEAGLESKIAVEIIEQFMEVGFNEMTAIDAVNSLMNIKFSEDEKFSTLDMTKIDLYTGNAKFMKVGAVESFIKRGSKIEAIDSKTLPFGVLENADIDTVEKKISNGDIIVTISDGILDINRDGSFSIEWLVEFLRDTHYKQPKDLSLAIVEKAKELSGGKANDDMTVVVSKIYALY
ncbi:stage II sporulation protein E [Clostridium tarantellae]|uniref:Stage II sporulation protein E n=1 Tax=Clostridium tarantellae TaxID=39493 RepID=A0A6I1MJ44_9CLOT|nr:stage II sporulation protein E [Clostridium tarantellae]MPQ42162.1 stage II sporulation protein E [Clostridium tarantellae]